MCTTAQTRAAKPDTIVHGHGDLCPRSEQMLLLIGVLLTLTAIVIIPRLRMPEAATLGRMSEQWLAEHRASHPS